MNTKKIDSLSPDVLCKMRQIEISTKRLLKGIVPGDSRSMQKGVGLDFDQIREYQMGDDVRFIDWSGTARTGTLLVKQYVQERARVILVAVDVSSSSFFSSGQERKCDIMAQVASVFALVAEYNNDSVGLLLFSDTVELYVPAGKGMDHVRKLMRILFTYEPKGARTSFDAIFKKLADLQRKDTIVMIISDFIGELETIYCTIVARLYSLIAVRCLDKNEHVMPGIGFMTLVDVETGEMVAIDTSNNAKKVDILLAARIDEQNVFFKKKGIDVLDVSVDQLFIGDMVRFFQRRMR